MGPLDVGAIREQVCFAQRGGLHILGCEPSPERRDDHSHALAVVAASPYALVRFSLKLFPPLLATQQRK